MDFLKIILLFLFGLFLQNLKCQNLTSANLTSNVKSLDVDDFCSISNELCIVLKGDKTALIDINGNFITPWGKYRFLLGNSECETKQFYGGVVKVEDKITSKVGFIDRFNRAVIPIKYREDELSNFTSAGITSLKVPSSRTTSYFDTKGNILFNINEDKYHFYNNISNEKTYLKENLQRKLFLFSEYFIKEQIYKFGFMNKAGKIIIPAIFELANQFSEGMASVGKTDEFGIIKWGYIDSTGKIKISYRFSTEPGYFHNKLALVKSSTISEFNYAYIDKEGTVKIKVNKTYEGTNFFPLDLNFKLSNNPFESDLKEKGSFIDGYSLWTDQKFNYFMDTIGQIFNSDKFMFEVYPINDSMRYKLRSINDFGIELSIDSKNQINDDNKIGIINLKGDIIYKPVFANISPDFFSHYAIASILLIDSPYPNKRVYRKGIINQNGLFTVIKTEKKDVW